MEDVCEIEIGTLPTVLECVPDDATVFISNVPQGLGQFGYAQITFGALKNCIKENITPANYEAITANTVSLTIDPDLDNFRVVDDSVRVYLDGVRLARGPLPVELEKIWYTVSYISNGNAVVNFDNAGAPLPNGQVLSVDYWLKRIV